MAAFGEYKKTGKLAVVVYFKDVPSIRLNGLQDTTKNLSIFGVRVITFLHNINKYNTRAKYL